VRFDSTENFGDKDRYSTVKKDIYPFFPYIVIEHLLCAGSIDKHQSVITK